MLRRIDESDYSDRVKALKGKRAARDARDAARNMSKLEKELNTHKAEINSMKEYIILKGEELLKREAKYVKEAYELITTVEEEGLKVPEDLEYFYYENNKTFYFWSGAGRLRSDNTGIETLAIGVDKSSGKVFLHLFYYGSDYDFDFENLKSMDFFEPDTLRNLDIFGGKNMSSDLAEYAAAEVSEEIVSKFYGIRQWYNSVKYDFKFSSFIFDRENWFKKFDEWITGLENEIDSDLDGDGNIGESKKVTRVVNRILEGADVRKTLDRSCAVVEGRSNIKASDICNLLDASDSEYSLVFADEESIIDGFKAVAPNMMKELEDSGYDLNYFEFRDWLVDFDRDDIELEDIGYNVVHIDDDKLNSKFYAWAYKRPVLKLVADYGEYYEYGGVLVVV